MKFIIIFLVVSYSASCLCIVAEKETNQKSVLILFEGDSTIMNPAYISALQFSMLLGHFRTDITRLSSEKYETGFMDKFDFACFIGCTRRCSPTLILQKDIMQRAKSFLWIFTGIIAFNNNFALSTRYGFEPIGIDSSSGYSFVHRGNATFTKGEKKICTIRIVDTTICKVIATASADNKVIPYCIRSNNFWYVADSPFAFASKTDRYLLFADLLHDMLDENHPSMHRALLRIEDIHPLKNPEQLCAIADVLYQERIPFLISLIPFYCDHSLNIQISISDKPKFAKAIAYMMKRGGTVVLHGVTHQYKGVTAADFEFWDIDKNSPITELSTKAIRNKIKSGVDECLRNNIYPLLWETPHYAASQRTYNVIASIFSSAIEQRLSVDNMLSSQFFPFVIYHDIHGEKIFPENLGLIAYSSHDRNAEEQSIQSIAKAAQTNLQVRDGYASCFFHTFIPVRYLKELIRTIKNTGYIFYDVRNENNSVTLDEAAIVTGSETVHLKLDNQFLRERIIDLRGRIINDTRTPNRIIGSITRTVSLKNRNIYIATAVN